ncbi:Uma2 family endonuclease [Microcoleus sp. S28C3]|uniref:Uma2 family endonuclease n=1 Tax=Microcoleus sp. S28C3 TaxID=3055414 RepID=UPI002FD3BD46
MMTVAPLDNPRLKTTQGVLLPTISCSTYQTLLAESGNRRSSKFAYSRGVLEIMMPSDLHKNINCDLKRIVTALTEKLHLRLKGFGSTSLNRSDLQQGTEPNSYFYIQNFDSIIGKKIEISKEVPPNLVIEVYLTRISSNRLRIYQQLAIIKRRYRLETVQIYNVQNPPYIFYEYSLSFLIMPATLLAHLIKISETQDDNAIVQYWWLWVRQQLQAQSL